MIDGKSEVVDQAILLQDLSLINKKMNPNRRSETLT